MKRVISGILAFTLMLFLVPMPVIAAPLNMQQIVKSKEEELEIVKFLNQYKYLDYEGFDLSNPDQELLGEFMHMLLIRNPEIVTYEKIWPEDELDEKWEYVEPNRKYKEVDVSAKCMALFGLSLDFENYLVGDEIDEMEEGYVYVGDPGDPEEVFTTYIKNIYSSGDGLIHMNIETLGTWDWDQVELIESTLYEDLPLSIKEGFYFNNPYNVVIKEVIKDGEMSYELIKYSRDEAPTIFVNGKILPVSAVKKDDRVLVPLRAIFEALDAQVEYDDASKVITGTKGDTVVSLTVNKKEAAVGNKKVLLDVPAQIINSSTLVPVRFIGESLGAEVEWKDNTVIINSNK